MGRPRTLPDDDVLAGAARVITRLGPDGLTLAEVARESGLAASTLVQRFGSKRGLLLALAERGAAGADVPFEKARAADPSPLGALVAGLTTMAGFAETPEALANHLAFFQLDLRDPDFARLALDHALAVGRHIRSLLGAAVDAGELNAPCDTVALARTVESTYNGSLVTWAVHRTGPVQDWLRTDLDLVLAPFRPARSRSR